MWNCSRCGRLNGPDITYCGCPRSEHMPDTFADKYEILTLLGRGGFATVYKAFDTTLNREVALKVLDRGVLNEENSIKRFRREARALAKLKHPNVISIYEIAVSADQYFIAMSYLPGGSLEQRMAQQDLSLETILRILSQVGAALDYAHEQGLVHRDVKPANILFDEIGNAILTDFGITKVVDVSEGLTQNMVIGTPCYMAPEQWTGSEVNASTDIYSLGVMLYQMLVGEPPFIGSGYNNILYKHILEPPPSPLLRNPTLPSSVEPILNKALSKRPDERYQTAQQFFEDMQLALASLPQNQPTIKATIVAAQLPSPSDTDFGRQLLISQNPAPSSKRRLREQISYSKISAFVIVIVEKDDYYLLIQEAKPERANSWYLPAGRVEPGESIIEAAKRETLEESGLSVEPRYFLRIEQGIPEHHKEGEEKIERWRYIIVAEVIGGALKTVADDNSLGAGWFRLEGLKDISLRSYEVIDLIEAYRRGSRLWPIDGYLLRVY